MQEVPIIYENSHIFSQSDLDLKDDVTLVTGYIDIGSFNKGHPNIFRSKRDYLEWMTIFEKIRNPVVAYMEQADDAQLFLDIRSRGNLANMTIVERVQRNSTWAFGLLPKITQVLRDGNYPKHLPNTVVPEYQPIQHIKYEYVHDVALKNPFRTKYFSWIDIGLFREIASKNVKPFKLYLPPNMDLSRVAYNEVTPAVEHTNEEIFRQNLYWVCGCFFIGARPTILKWTKEYMYYAEKYLNQGLANTDQRVIYAMQKNEVAPEMRIQAYKPLNAANPWFDLGYRCRDEGLKRM